MHYDVDYTELEGEAKRKKAIADIKAYMGSHRYKHLTNLLKAEPHMELEAFRMAASFAGVQGYPVVAWHEEIWGKAG